MNKRECLYTVLLAAGLLLICGLSYGLTASKLGFFLDDWLIIWTYRVFGTNKFYDFFLRDRPLFSYVYKVFIPIIKDSLLGWQFFAIFTKWLSAMTLWWLQKLLLPEKKWFTYAVSALFLVYPGFKFHYFVVMYSQNYALLAIYLLSYTLMILALRNPEKRVLLTILAMLCQFIGIAPMEYYYGLELVRPVLLFLAMPRTNSRFGTNLLATLKNYLPYALVLLGFTAFRVLMRESYSYQIGFIEQFLLTPLEAFKDIFSRMVQGLFASCVTVWIELLRSLYHSQSITNILSRLGLVGAVFGLFLYCINKTVIKLTDSGSEVKKTLILIGLGLYTVLVGMIPFLIAGFDIGISFHNNRFLVTLSIGVSLLIVSIIDLVIRKKFLKWILLALIVGVSVEANHMTGLEFQKAWEGQKDFFTQLTWRAPQILPGTVIITPDLPFEQYFSGGSLTAPLNMIYAPNLHDNPIPYQVMLAKSSQMNSMPDLIPEQPISKASRVFRFSGNTSEMLTVYMPEQGCLKVIQPDTDPKTFESIGSVELWSKLIPLSDLTRIETAALNAVLPKEYFGEVLTNTWCYYYERAALAEQRAEWSEVVAIYAQATVDGVEPKAPSEWLPLINAKIQLKEIDTALALIKDLKFDDAFSNQGLCSIWQKDELSLTPTQQQTLGIMLEQWQCEEK